MTDSFQRLARRVLCAFGRGRATATDDSGDMQVMQVKFNALETVDSLPRMMEFGFTSHVPLDTDLLTVFANGDRSNSVIVGSNHHASRPKGLAEGEAAVFNAVGIRIYLMNGGLVIEGAGLPLTVNNTPHVTVNASAEVDLNTPRLKVSGEIISGGQISAGGDITDNSGSNAHSMAQMRQIYNGHNHPVSSVEPGQATVFSGAPPQQE